MPSIPCFGFPKNSPPDSHSKGVLGLALAAPDESIAMVLIATMMVVVVL
jgi:hypothetical protein